MLDKLPPKGDARVVKDLKHLGRLLRPGVALRVFSNRAFVGPRLHVRAVVDGDQVLVRRWVGNRWVYSVEPVATFEAHVRDGSLSVAAYGKT